GSQLLRVRFELNSEGGGAPQLLKHLPFDLSDTDAAETELLADLTERPLLPPAVEPEAQADHLSLARLQVRAQRRVERAGQGGILRLLGWPTGARVRDEVGHRRVTFVADRRFERDWDPSGPERLLDLLGLDAEPVADLLRRRGAPELVLEVARGVVQLGELGDDVDRQPDGPPLVGD